MPDLANLTPAGVDLPEDSLYVAVVIDAPTSTAEDVRCVVSSESDQLAFDPMRWNPIARPGEGFFFPKPKDAALIAIPANGDPVLLEWWPAPDAEPDAPLS
jgi:hypothetical protein